MNQPSQAATTPSDIIVPLNQKDSAEPRAIDQLIQRKRYERLREQIVSHLDTLTDGGPALRREYPTGNGWTQFLDGTRGAGKSTFLSSMRSALESDVEVKGRMAFLPLIDPSRIERSEIILLVILQHLKTHVERVLKDRRKLEEDQLREEWRQAFRGVAGGLSLFADGYHPLNELDPDLFLDWGLERASDGTSLRARLSRLFAAACSILEVRAIMLAFDDADTDTTHAINLLECVRKYLDIPLVMVLVTGDLELYSLLVQQHFALTVAGKREAALELQRHAVAKDRSTQYLRMIAHLEEQYLLKLFPIVRRTQLRPLWNVMQESRFLATFPAWGSNYRPVGDVIEEIVRRGLRVKNSSDVAIYTEFLLTQPLRSVLQVMDQCARYLDGPSIASSDLASWSEALTSALSQALHDLALTNLYKFSIDTDAIASRDLPALVDAVFELSLQDGDIDTAMYLRPMSANRDIRVCFVALAAEVPNFCGHQAGTTLRYLLRGPGSISLYSLAATKRNVDDIHLLERFKSYMGIGRKEDGLDWARRATAVISLIHPANSKARVVLPGVVGLTRRGRPNEHTARSAIRLAFDSPAINYLPVFALSIVDVADATGTRSYASIFAVLGLIEKLLSATTDDEARIVFNRAYPSVTVSAPNWSSHGGAKDQDGEEPAEERWHDQESTKQEDLWHQIQIWRDYALQLVGEIAPSAIFLGKVWTRLFFSLQNAADELKAGSNFADIMEIFALCVVNAFLIEEAEHHCTSSGSTNAEMRIYRGNPRTSAADFVGKIRDMRPNRATFPLTSIVATCPLLLGLLNAQLEYANALSTLFYVDTEPNVVNAMLRPEALGELMAVVAVAGESRARRSPRIVGSTSANTGESTQL